MFGQRRRFERFGEFELRHVQRPIGLNASLELSLGRVMGLYPHLALDTEMYSLACASEILRHSR